MPEKTKKIDRWRLPLVVGALAVLAAVIAAAIGVLIAHDRTPVAPAAFASRTPSPTVAADPHGRKACELNKQIRDSAALPEDADVQRVLREAQQSTNTTIGFAAQMLFDQQAISAREARRGGSNLDLLLAADTASIQLQTTCVNAGFY